MLLKLHARLAARLRNSLDTPVVHESTAVEHRGLDALLDAHLAELLANHASRLHGFGFPLLRAHNLLNLGGHGTHGQEGVGVLVVDDLHVGVLVGAVDGDAGTISGAAHLGTDLGVALLTPGLLLSQTPRNNCRVHHRGC